MAWTCPVCFVSNTVKSLRYQNVVWWNKSADVGWLAIYFLLGVPINQMGIVGKSSLQLTGLDCVLCVKLLSRSIFSIISVIPPGHCMWGLLCRVNAHQRGVKNGSVQNTVISSVRMVWFAFKSFAVWGWPPPPTPLPLSFPLKCPILQPGRLKSSVWLFKYPVFGKNEQVQLLMWLQRSLGPRQKLAPWCFYFFPYVSWKIRY